MCCRVLLGPIQIINHTLLPHVMTHIDIWKVLSSLIACWMWLVKESLHDVIPNVWNSYRSAVKIILQFPRVKKREREARGTAAPHFLWLTVRACSLFSSSTVNEKKSYFSFHLGILQIWLSGALSTHTLLRRCLQKNIKASQRHARLHVHKGRCSPGRKGSVLYIVSACEYLCVQKGGRKSLLPTKPLDLLSLSSEYINRTYGEQKQHQQHHSQIRPIGYSIWAFDITVLSLAITPLSQRLSLTFSESQQAHIPPSGANICQTLLYIS